MPITIILLLIKLGTFIGCLLFSGHRTEDYNLPKVTHLASGGDAENWYLCPG